MYAPCSTVEGSRVFVGSPEPECAFEIRVCRHPRGGGRLLYIHAERPSRKHHIYVITHTTDRCECGCRAMEEERKTFLGLDTLARSSYRDLMIAFVRGCGRHICGLGYMTPRR